MDYFDDDYDQHIPPQLLHQNTQQQPPLTDRVNDAFRVLPQKSSKHDPSLCQYETYDSDFEKEGSLSRDSSTDLDDDERIPQLSKQKVHLHYFDQKSVNVPKTFQDAFSSNPTHLKMPGQRDGSRNKVALTNSAHQHGLVTVEHWQGFHKRPIDQRPPPAQQPLTQSTYNVLSTLAHQPRNPHAFLAVCSDLRKSVERELDQERMKKQHAEEKDELMAKFLTVEKSFSAHFKDVMDENQELKRRLEQALRAEGQALSHFPKFEVPSLYYTSYDNKFFTSLVNTTGWSKGKGDMMKLMEPIFAGCLTYARTKAIDKDNDHPGYCKYQCNILDVTRFHSLTKNDELTARSTIEQLLLATVLPPIIAVDPSQHREADGREKKLFCNIHQQQQLVSGRWAIRRGYDLTQGFIFTFRTFSCPHCVSSFPVQEKDDDDDFDTTVLNDAETRTNKEIKSFVSNSSWNKVVHASSEYFINNLGVILSYQRSFTEDLRSFAIRAQMSKSNANEFTKTLTKAYGESQLRKVATGLEWVYARIQARPNRSGTNLLTPSQWQNVGAVFNHLQFSRLPLVPSPSDDFIRTSIVQPRLQSMQRKLQYTAESLKGLKSLSFDGTYRIADLSVAEGVTVRAVYFGLNEYNQVLSCVFVPSDHYCHLQNFFKEINSRATASDYPQVIYTDKCCVDKQTLEQNFYPNNIKVCLDYFHWSRRWEQCLSIKRVVEHKIIFMAIHKAMFTDVEVQGSSKKRKHFDAQMVQRLDETINKLKETEKLKTIIESPAFKRVYKNQILHVQRGCLVDQLPLHDIYKEHQSGNVNKVSTNRGTNSNESLHSACRAVLSSHAKQSPFTTQASIMFLMAEYNYDRHCSYRGDTRYEFLDPMILQRTTAVAAKVLYKDHISQADRSQYENGLPGFTSYFRFLQSEGDKPMCMDYFNSLRQTTTALQHRPVVEWPTEHDYKNQAHYAIAGRPGMMFAPARETIFDVSALKPYTVWYERIKSSSHFMAASTMAGDNKNFCIAPPQAAPERLGMPPFDGFTQCRDFILKQKPTKKLELLLKSPVCVDEATFRRSSTELSDINNPQKKNATTDIFSSLFLSILKIRFSEEDRYDNGRAVDDDDDGGNDNDDVQDDQHPVQFMSTPPTLPRQLDQQEGDEDDEEATTPEEWNDFIRDFLVEANKSLPTPAVRFNYFMQHAADVTCSVICFLRSGQRLKSPEEDHARTPEDHARTAKEGYTNVPLFFPAKNYQTNSEFSPSHIIFLSCHHQSQTNFTVTPLGKIQYSFHSTQPSIAQNNLQPPSSPVGNAEDAAPLQFSSPHTNRLETRKNQLSTTTAKLLDIKTLDILTLKSMYHSLTPENKTAKEIPIRVINQHGYHVPAQYVTDSKFRKTYYTELDKRVKEIKASEETKLKLTQLMQQDDGAVDFDDDNFFPENEIDNVRFPSNAERVKHRSASRNNIQMKTNVTFDDDYDDDDDEVPPSNQNVRNKKQNLFFSGAKTGNPKGSIKNKKTSKTQKKGKTESKKKTLPKPTSKKR